MKIEGGVASFNQSKFKTLDHFYIFLPTDFPPHLVSTQSFYDARSVFDVMTFSNK